MKSMPREAWSYALLLVVLCATASIAVRETMSFLDTRLTHEDFEVAAFALWALTLGFMLTAGAFGLWATQFAAAAETRRRISELVQTMHYIRDPVVAIDTKGRITGANPAAQRLAGVADAPPRSLRDLFSCLTQKDILLLTNTKSPNEIERRSLRNGTPSILRFRSQPSRNVTMIIISDVTTMNQNQARSRQSAQLQLIGEISRDIANDFNGLLCEISSHASLIRRLASGTTTLQASTRAIIRASERGVSLSGQLIELAKSAPRTSPATLPGIHVHNAVLTLRNLLPDAWRVETGQIGELPALSLTGAQMEQIVLNLGLLAADAIGEAGSLHIRTDATAAEPREGAPHDLSAEIDILARHPDHTPPAAGGSPHDRPRTASAAILSVIRSLVVEAGGTLRESGAEDGGVGYRLTLRPARAVTAAAETADFPRELGAYVSGWSALLAAPNTEFDFVEARMRELNMTVDRANNIVSALSRIERTEYQTVVLDGRIMEQEMQGLLRALIKLQPSAGVVVLCDNPEAQPARMATAVVFLAENAKPNEILLAMVEARSIAMHRAAAAG